jgi:hypothetical protein
MAQPTWGWRKAAPGEGTHFDAQYEGRVFDDGVLPDGWFDSPQAAEAAAPEEPAEEESGEGEEPAPRRRGRPRKAD